MKLPLLIASVLVLNLSAVTILKPTEAIPASPMVQKYFPSPLKLLFIAELSRVNKNYALASHNYLLLAKQFNEAVLAKRATIYAVKAGALVNTAAAAKVWAQVEPNNAYPQFLSATFLIDEGQITAAVPFIKNIFFLDSTNAIVATQAIYEGLSNNRAKQQLSAIIEQLTNEYPHNYQLTYCTAWLALKQKQLDLAWQQINTTLAIKSNWPEAMNLRAQILVAKQEPLSAINYLQQQMQANQQNATLKMYYAILLLETKKLTAAKEQLQQLSSIPEQRSVALVYLGRIALAQKQLSEAFTLLGQAIASDKNNNPARLLLGEVAQEANHLGEAMDWYKSVGEGKYYISAQVHAAFLFAATGNNKKAISVLETLPFTTPAEYKMVALAKIKVLLENKAYYSALNIINNSLKLLPQDNDLLLLGSHISKQITDYKAAINYMAIAYNTNPTAEIAAHYGALLWQSGNHAQAEKIWQSALKKYPQDEILKATIKKYKP